MRNETYKFIMPILFDLIPGFSMMVHFSGTGIFVLRCSFFFFFICLFIFAFFASFPSVYLFLNFATTPPPSFAPQIRMHTLTNRVLGPHCKLRTEFFPHRFMAQTRSVRAINRRGKTRIRNLQYGPRKRG